MQAFMILAITGTEKDTLVLYSMQIVDGRIDGRTDGRTDGKLNSYTAKCYKQVQ